jgi:hypothetical protein
MVPVPANGSEANQSAGAAGEHTIIVRAYDRFDNMGTGKVTVNATEQ